MLADRERATTNMRGKYDQHTDQVTPTAGKNPAAGKA